MIILWKVGNLSQTPLRHRKALHEQADLEHTKKKSLVLDTINYIC